MRVESQQLAGRLELELTESVLIETTGPVTETLDKLREMGIGLSIDDFGTGYSSLSYLYRFPLDTLKIDRSFLQRMLEREDSRAIISAIIAMAHSLHLRVIAEGVESEEQLELLRAQGCDAIQGYLISKPLPAGEFEDLVRRYARPDGSCALGEFGLTVAG